MSDKTINKTFGNRMRQRRHEMEITLQELADTIASSRSYLNQVELGKKNVTLDMAHRIATMLDTTVRNCWINFTPNHWHRDSSAVRFPLPR
ncbi:MAG: helix-turn-helix transcriptional regulator [Caldilineaceae bacterium]